MRMRETKSFLEEEKINLKGEGLIFTINL